MDILVVDDDEIDQKLLYRSLTKSLNSIKIKFASDVASARNHILIQEFDVILLDQRLPDADGISFLIEIKANKTTRNTTVVMVSNDTDENLAMRCLKSGAQDFVLKSSVNPIMLKTIIANAKTRQQLEEDLRLSHERTQQLAQQDPLTGLSNRYFFEQSLKHALSSRNKESPITVIFLDLDNFKMINDTWSHKHGDELLRRVAVRTTSCLRGDEVFARFGGDEFVILLHEPHTINDITRITQRILQVLAPPFEFDGFTFYTSASIGVSFNPNHNISPEVLTSQADIAMHKAKQDGKSQVCFFEKDMQKAFTNRLRIENGLRNALINGEFCLHYQPIMLVENNSLVGFEALIRWNQDGTLVPPDIFIPVAQESNLIMEIGRWVISEVIHQLSQLSPALYIAINLSPLQLRDPSLIDFLVSECQAYGVSRHRLVLELTETAFTDQRTDVYDAVAQLRKDGFKVALDDFGTGFSSLSHLRNLPITTVKIDKSMLPSANNHRLELLLRGLVQMIQALDLDLVVEGVETEIQRQLCIDLGAVNAQGLFFGKPESIDYYICKNEGP